MKNGLMDFLIESNQIEGIEGTTLEQLDAARKFLSREYITVPDLQKFVFINQPDAVLRAEEGLNVRVGKHIAPPGGPAIETALQDLLIQCNMAALSPFRAHLIYEDLHPFTDGNGRSGRILWLWMHRGVAPLGFLHHFYYETLENSRP